MDNDVSEPEAAIMGVGAGDISPNIGCGGWSILNPPPPNVLAYKTA